MACDNRATGESNNGTNGGWSSTKSRYGIAPSTMRKLEPNHTPSSYSKRAWSPPARSSWNNPSASEKRAIALTARSLPNAGQPPDFATVAGGPCLFLEYPAEDDGALIENHHRDRQREESERVVARCHNGSHYAYHDYGRPAPLPPRPGRHNARDHQEHHDYRVEENAAKNKADEQVQRDVRGERVARRDVRPGDVDQPGEGLGPYQDCRPDPHREQHQRRRNKGNGVLLLVLGETRGNETPYLPQPHRCSERNADVGGNFQAGQEAFGRPQHQE